jgi:hypothetical protein
MSIYLHPFSATIWALSTLAAYALAWIVLFQPGQRRHDLFAAYCTFYAVTETLLIYFSALGDGWAYYRVYTCTSPTQDALGVACVVHYCWRACKNYLRQPSAALNIGLQFFPYLVCAISIVARFHFSKNSIEWEIVLLSGGLLWVISSESDKWRVLWRTREYGVAAGFLLLFASRVILVGLREVIPAQVRPMLFVFDVSGMLLVVSVWIRYFLKKEPELLSPTLQQLTAIQALIHSFENKNR